MSVAPVVHRVGVSDVETSGEEVVQCSVCVQRKSRSRSLGSILMFFGDLLGQFESSFLESPNIFHRNEITCIQLIRQDRFSEPQGPQTVVLIISNLSKSLDRGVLVCE